MAMNAFPAATLRLSFAIPFTCAGTSPFIPTRRPRSASAVLIASTLTFIREDAAAERLCREPRSFRPRAVCSPRGLCRVARENQRCAVLAPHPEWAAREHPELRAASPGRVWAVALPADRRCKLAAGRGFLEGGCGSGHMTADPASSLAVFPSVYPPFPFPPTG